MKNLISTLAFLGLFAVSMTSCHDKAAEKRIAQLEARIAELEGKNAGNAPATMTPTATAAPEEKPDGPLPAMTFETMDHDFGTIKQGDVVKYTYKFKNTGDAPLVIQNVQGSCGCTVPVWSKEPVPVGGDGVITAQFNSAGKSNLQNKTVTVTANTWPKNTTLRFKAMVTPKEETPAK